MASLSRSATVQEYSDFVSKVYGIPNDRYYTLWDMLTNIQRFTMRGIKGVRKGDTEKTKENIMICLSWYMSLMNRLHISVPDIVWNRFPYVCSYCGEQPCACKSQKIQSRRSIRAGKQRQPRTISEFQIMFDKIYPAERRTPQAAAIHLAEETGELSEAFLIYMSRRDNSDLQNIYLEAADYFSCIMGVLNSLDISSAEELSKLYTDNCHVCHNAPCICSFEYVSNFKS